MEKKIMYHNILIKIIPLIAVIVLSIISCNKKLADKSVETDEVLISVSYVDESFFKRYKTYEQYDINNEYAHKIAFIPNVPVKDFSWLSIGFDWDDDGGLVYVVEEELYSMEELHPQKPLVVSWVEVGMMSVFGYSYRDTDGQKKYFVGMVRNYGGDEAEEEEAEGDNAPKEPAGPDFIIWQFFPEAPEQDFNQNIIDNNKTYADLITEWKTTNELEGYTAYYALYDIDGNGIKELILRKENDYDDVIDYIYSIKDSKPINVFGYSGNGEPIEVPSSRYGSSVILNNGLIDSSAGDYSIYKIADDGYTAIMIAKAEPYDYPDEASRAEAKWRYFIGDKWVDDYGIYAKYLDEQGYNVWDNEGNTEANIYWLKLQ